MKSQRNLTETVHDGVHTGRAQSHHGIWKSGRGQTWMGSNDCTLWEGLIVMHT